MSTNLTKQWFSWVLRKKPYINAVNHKKDWLLQKPILIKVILFGIKSSFQTSQSLTFLDQVVKIMCKENQIRNWKFDIYIKQWNTEVDRSWCGGIWLLVALEIWYSLMEYLISISIPIFKKITLKKVPVN